MNANRESFLNNKFIINDELYEERRACVWYTIQKDDFSMEVSEWFYQGKEKIAKVISYYNVGNVSYKNDLNRAK